MDFLFFFFKKNGLQFGSVKKISYRNLHAFVQILQIHSRNFIVHKYNMYFLFDFNLCVKTVMEGTSFPTLFDRTVMMYYTI